MRIFSNQNCLSMRSVIAFKNNTRIQNVKIPKMSAEKLSLPVKRVLRLLELRERQIYRVG